MSAPSVARVLLIAHPARERELAPWLGARGAPVGYALEKVTPEDAVRALEGVWDVIVVDGESLCDDDDREALLRAVRVRPEHFATLLYVCTRLPSEDEIEAAFLWADDQLSAGWRFGQRLQRRVTSLALAPWRSTLALRQWAERLGDRRLRLVGGAAKERARPAPGQSAERALPEGIGERTSALGERVPSLVSEAFVQGRRAGVLEAGAHVEAFCARWLDEIEQTARGLPAEVVRALEGREPGAAVADAQVSGARWAICAVRAEMKRHVRGVSWGSDRQER